LGTANDGKKEGCAEELNGVASSFVESTPVYLKKPIQFKGGVLMKKQKLIVGVLLIILLVASVNVNGAAKKVTLKLGHGVTATHTIHIAAEKFANLVSERSKGLVQVDIFPNRQLGEERDMVEGLQLGTVDMTIVSTGPLGGFVPEVGVVDLPFLFTSSEHAYKVLDGPIGQGILKKFEARNMIGLSFMENGWRNISTSKKKVMKPEDLKGMKIRTMENKVHIAAFQAMGAAPLPMVWGEVYTSLQQGVIDGQENPPVILATNALWEVQKYYALTKHFYTPQVFLLSKKTYKGLPANLRKVIKNAAMEVTVFQRDLSQKQTQNDINLLKQKGMDVYEVDRKVFQESTKSVYKKFENVFGKKLIKQIIDSGK
jgi:tripartite ATP-independent transporter DctP family solute receptor